MRLAIYERLYRFNFHLIEARRILEELGLALRIDEVEEYRRLRWDSMRRAAKPTVGVAARSKAWRPAREMDSIHGNSTPAKYLYASRLSRGSRSERRRVPGGHYEQSQIQTARRKPASTLPKLWARQLPYQLLRRRAGMAGAGSAFYGWQLLSFGFSPQVKVRVEYLESRRGDLEVIREYGIVEEKHAEDAKRWEK